VARPSKTPAAIPSDAATTIGPAIQISGRIEGEEDLRVLGRVEGAISLTETLFVDAEGIVQADVSARDVVISGIVLGNVTADNSVTLNPGARLIGNIAAPRLIISDGAAFAGDVEMGDAPPRERTERDRARAASYVTGSTATPRPASRSSTARSTSARGSSPAPASTSRAASRRAAPARAMDEDDITVVVKHSELARGEEAPASSEESATVSRAPAPKKKAAKKKTRVRVPARGKRRVNRR